MVNGRNKGNNFERQLAQKFREQGFPNAVCSRAESKNADDAGIDIMFTGVFNTQAKAVERFGKHHEVLKAMPQDARINVIFHKRNNKGTTVTMSEEGFWRIVGLIRNEPTKGLVKQEIDADVQDINTEESRP